MSRPASISSNNGAPLPALSDAAKSPFQERAETFQQLEKAQKRKSRSETELQSLVRIRSSTPNMSPMEMGQKDKEIFELRQQIGSMNQHIQDMLAKLDQQETLIAQQRATIHNQSKAIENPRGHSSFNAPSPRRFAPEERKPHLTEPRSQNSGGPFEGYRPAKDSSSWRLPYDTSTSTHAPGQPSQALTYARNQGFPSGSTFHTDHNSQMSVRHQSYHGANDLGSPEPFKPAIPGTPGKFAGHREAGASFTAGQDSNNPFVMRAPTSASKFNATAPPFQLPQGMISLPVPERPGSNPFSESAPECGTPEKLTLAEKIGSGDAAVAEQFEKVLASCKNWALNHCNHPNTSGDNALPQELKGRIIRAASMQTAFPLMKSSETRYWLVTKIIVLYVIKHVLKQNTFSGLDKEADQCIDGLRATIYQSTPAQLRFVILKSIAQQTQKIIDHPKFAQYVQHLTKQRAEKLFWDIRSLKHQASLRDQEDIILLIHEAHKLAQMINTSTTEYSFAWAEAGDRFDVFSMHNVCPRWGGLSDEELRARWATVRLAATPQVLARKNSAEGQVHEVKLCRMRVLIQVKNAE